jgi:ketosteroid isomerase-like protein
MKRIFVLCGLVLLATASWTLAQKSGGADKAIADLEGQWLKGQQTNNVSLIEPILAEGFVNTSSDGKVEDRAGAIADAKATKYTSVEYVDLKVKVYGNTGVATGVFRAKGTDSAGKPLDANERFTDTWTKMASGKWQCVASHQSPIKK